MPLNKLDNFIKNTEGRILYVSPADLDSTDSISNQGNSLARPFKTLQRALIEAARFSYFKGKDNDIVEKTTILLMPGEHQIDNRPGYAIATVNSGAIAYHPDGSSSNADDALGLSLESNFDLNQENNVLYKFNSVHGGVIVPRGTSIVGLDLRKTKIRPKYVPNPTFGYDTNPNSAIFRITGGCYFWQFSIFDGNDTDLVYTDNKVFTSEKKSRPRFSHNKLTCFEYADGINDVAGYDLTDLEMYYAKLSNGYGLSAGERNIDEKYPASLNGFTSQKPEYEIVGAFNADPINISTIVSGDGSTATNVITVTTSTDHNLQEGNPIKIKGVGTAEYNISTKVRSVDPVDKRKFTYSLDFFPSDIDASPVKDPQATAMTVTVETDTVDGASPYIFNVSLRSVWGMNGLHADGSKASGFRSMVVAQFTGISLQKDDRSFVKYNPKTKSYDPPQFESTSSGTSLSIQSSATNNDKVYHLDSSAIYRSGWETTHIKITNDAILQIVSVFAIGYNKHFEAQSGGDASITNSNSNFGQLSLISEGFKKEAFDKDNKAFITHIIPPRAITTTNEDIDWLTIDAAKTRAVNDNTKLFLNGFENNNDLPPTLTQGYRIGAKINDKLYVKINNAIYSADILMSDGISSSYVEKNVTTVPTSSNSSTFGVLNHGFTTGEKVIVISKTGDMPENISENVVYYIVDVNANEIRLASSESNAFSSDLGNDDYISAYLGSDLKIISRVSDKVAGDVAHPIQFDSSTVLVGNETKTKGWYLNTNNSNINDGIFKGILDNTSIDITNASYVKRIADTRSLDERIYKIRVVVPKDLIGGKTPESGFTIQETSSTGYRNNQDFNKTTITKNDYDFNKKLRHIVTCSSSNNGDTPTTYTITVDTELPHNLNNSDVIIIRHVKSSENTTGVDDKGFNGTFKVTEITSDTTFKYIATNNPGTFTASTLRDTVLPRFERNDLQNNIYVYRNEVISEYDSGNKNGIYHIYALSADYSVGDRFPDLKYSQNVVDLYPQLDRDNINDSPRSAKSNSVRSPLGKVVTNDLKNSLTKETVDKLLTSFGKGLKISSVDNSSNTNPVITFERNHGLGGIISGDLAEGLNGYTAGTYYNVKLYNTQGAQPTYTLSNWNGATAKVVASLNTQTGNIEIASVDIMNPGSGYNSIAASNGRLYFDRTDIGGPVDQGTGSFILSTDKISSCIGKVVQFTGDTNADDLYYRISAITDTNKITLEKKASDPDPTSNQYAVILDYAVSFTGATVGSESTINTTDAHGLNEGNRFRIIGSDNTNYGDFIVSERVDYNTVKVAANIGTASGFILKHGLSSNDKTSDASAENIAARGLPIQNDISGTFQGLVSNNDELIQVYLKGRSDAEFMDSTFSLGSYLQIDQEVIRVKSITNNNLGVIRGSLGTKKTTHEVGSLVRKIEPLPIEFRRPSILRASGHTFEYLGYGPGNYSTGLPQVQDRTLTEKEEFLSQSQERSGGVVVYTGMNNKGDFYIGNQKKSSATGEEVTFDTPVPTVTGEDPTRLSVVFDEVTIKERMVVEGGDSKQVLSQFEGPVTFSNKLLMKNAVKVTEKVTSTSNIDIDGQVHIKNETSSSSYNEGALIVNGGVGIAGNLYINSDLNVPSHGGIFQNIRVADTESNTIDTSSGNLTLDAFEGSKVAIQTNTDIAGNTDISGELTVSGDITAFSSSDERLKDNITPIDDPLAKVLSISGNTFDWNDKSKKRGNDTGLIAQEVEALELPGLVVTRDNGYLAVDYHKVVPLLVEAIKELSGKVDALEQRLQDK